ncbi:MAG: O-methyltransferase [Lachnospiraceae bacterium]|nr:O-methyltransferase [Lachnospiraceae bacterium]
MITDERTAAFIDTFLGEISPFLTGLESSAAAEGIPVIRKSTQSILRFILADKNPKNILEIGTAVGFSAIFMATCADPPVHIDTIENYGKRIEEAKKNIRAAGMEDAITLIEGDAGEVLEDLVRQGRTYDMIFMDAAKAQYLSYLPLCSRMLPAGGILAADNVLFDGDIVQSRFAVRRRDRTIHARMREYLRVLSEDEEFVTTILPVGDGMTLSVKR